MSALQSAVHQGLQYRQFAWSRLHSTNNVKVTPVRYHVPYEVHWLQPGPVVGSQHIQRQQQQQSLIQRRHRHQLTLTPASSSSSSAAGAFNPDDYNLNNSVSSSSSRFLAGLSSLFQSHYLPLALITALLLGVICPGPGVAAAQLKIPSITTFGIFVVQGLQLRRKEAAAALSATGALAYGLLSILLLTPLIGILMVQLPLDPAALALGLGLFAAMPTALSSGVTFTQQLGGNVSLALLLTVSSNILGIFTMPFILPHILAAAPVTAAAAAAAGGSSSVSVLEPVPLLLQLCQTILLPTCLGAAVRGGVPGAAAVIDAHKRELSYLSAALLALVPWMQISKTASQHMSVSLLSVAGAAVAGVMMHGVFLAMNYTAARLLHLGGAGAAGRDVRRAVLLVASVKTLPVAVTVCSKLSGVLGDAVVGVAVVPCVMAHLGQILFDSVMVSRWLAADKAAQQQQQQQQPGSGKSE